MALFRIEIDTANDAFEERNREVARILTTIARSLDNLAADVTDIEDGVSAVVWDANGNNVGFWVFDGDDMPWCEHCQSYHHATARHIDR